MEVWIEGVSRWAIHIDVDVAYERIAAILEARLAGHYVGTALLLGQGDRLDAGGALGLRHDGPGDFIAIPGELLPQHVLQAHPLYGVILVRDPLASFFVI